MSERRRSEDCTCTFVEPVRHGEVITDGAKKRPIYLDWFEDDSVIDPACPFHGENGSMVMVIHATRSAPPVGASTQATNRGQNEASLS